MHPTYLVGAPDVVTPADTLRGAGQYLIRHGWHQGDMFADPDQPMPAACALGAIRMTVIGSPVVDVNLLRQEMVDQFTRAVGALADHLVLCYGVTDLSEMALVDVLDSGPEQVIADWN